MPKFEYQFGIVVEADDEQDAWSKVSDAAAALEALDVDKDLALDGPFLWNAGAAFPSA